MKSRKSKERPYLILVNREKYKVINTAEPEFTNPDKIITRSIDNEVEKAIQEMNGTYVMITSQTIRPEDGKLVDLYVNNKKIKQGQLTPNTLEQELKGYKFTKQKMNGLCQGYNNRHLQPPKLYK